MTEPAPPNPPPAWFQSKSSRLSDARRLDRCGSKPCVFSVRGGRGGSSGAPSRRIVFFFEIGDFAAQTFVALASGLDARPRP